MTDYYLIRVGSKSFFMRGGHCDIEIAGAFTREDIDDCLSLLELAARSLKRQAAANRPEIVQANPETRINIGDSGAEGGT
jgi:hypothetical protein